jgi:hypothetical protein
MSVSEEELRRHWLAAYWGHEEEGTDEADPSELEEVAVASIPLYYVSESRSHVAGVWRCDAYDLGDEYYYIVEYQDDKDVVIDAIPKEEAEETFRRVATDSWGDLNTGPFPDTFSVYGSGEPWLLRYVVQRFQGEELSDNGDTMWDRFGFDNHDLVVLDEDEYVPFKDELLRVWHRVVRSQPALPEDQLPPGFAVEDLVNQEYMTWLDQATLHWRDTDEVLSRQGALALRVMIYYFTSAGYGAG